MSIIIIISIIIIKIVLQVQDRQRQKYNTVWENCTSYVIILHCYNINNLLWAEAFITKTAKQVASTAQTAWSQ